MPYPNEHAARLREPGDFAPDTFRRTAGGTIYGRIQVPQTVGIIWGKLKAHSAPADKPIPQALRFAKANWTADAAKGWLKRNGVQYISFEPASGKPAAEAPRGLTLSAEAELHTAAAEGEQAAGPPTFRIKGYTGGAMKICGLPYPVVLDLLSMSAAKSLAVLLDHDSRQIVGQATTVEIGQAGVDIDGVVTGDLEDKTEPAAKVVGHAKRGFKWGASISWTLPEWETIADKSAVKVNGREFTGPLHIGRACRLREVSFVAVGADENAGARIAAEGFLENAENPEQETTMTEQKTAEDAPASEAAGQDTATAGQASSPDAIAQAVAADRKRIADVTAALGGEAFAAICEKAIAGGMSLEAAKAEAFDVLKAEIGKTSEKLTAAESKIATMEKLLGSRGLKADALKFDASDTQAAAQAAGDGEDPAIYEARVAEHVAAGMKRGKAMMQAGKELPKAKAAWDKAQTDSAAGRKAS